MALKKEVQKYFVLYSQSSEKMNNKKKILPNYESYIATPFHSQNKNMGLEMSIIKCPNNMSSTLVMSTLMQPNAAAVFSMSNEGFVPPPSLHPSLSLLSMCHICGLCGDVSLLRMDSPAQKRPYYIYILLHH